LIVARGFKRGRRRRAVASDAGFTQVELMCLPGTREPLEALAPVAEAIHAD
jgi:hypothetical protein